MNSFETKRNITASYDTCDMICINCHLKLGQKILYKSQKQSVSDYSSPSVFVVADQSFPAHLATGGEGECLRVLRLEDGSLPDLTNIFLETLRAFSVPAGSVVLLHSLSHLAWVGPTAYAEDLVRARQRICGTYRSGISVLHGLPMPPDGSLDTALVNDLAAIANWQVLAKPGSERDITSTRLVWKSLFKTASSAHGKIAPTDGQPPAPSLSSSSSLCTVCSMPPALPSCAIVQPPATVTNTAGWPSAPAPHNGPSGSLPAPLYCTPPARGPISQRLRMPASLDSLKPTSLLKTGTGVSHWTPWGSQRNGTS